MGSSKQLEEQWRLAREIGRLESALARAESLYIKMRVQPADPGYWVGNALFADAGRAQQAAQEEFIREVRPDLVGDH